MASIIDLIDEEHRALYAKICEEEVSTLTSCET